MNCLSINPNNIDINIIGKYVNKSSPKDYIEFEKDGRFISREEGISIIGKWEANYQINECLGLIIQYAHNNKDLTNSEHMKKLLMQIEGVENRIAVERNKYAETCA